MKKEDNVDYWFYGHEDADVAVRAEEYGKIRDPRHLYDLLTKIWCRYSCTPRMRDDWSPENPTVGQCSITSFLVQDIFGGRVFGVPLGDGNFHCYNEVGGHVFDLTSEQFGERKLIYDCRNEQLRDVHFAREEKQQRYLYLKKKLEEELQGE